jgi:RNA polymerase sigma factor (TIGR02999 family)
MLAPPNLGASTPVGQIRADSNQSLHKLTRLIYDELHSVAVMLMSCERVGHTLQPTALLHEAVLRLLRGNHLEHTNDNHALVGLAARTMREVLADYARQRRARKRGGSWERIPLDEVLAAFERRGIDCDVLHEALERLADLHPRQAEVVTLRYLVGWTEPEVAAHLGVSVSTVQSDFRIARAWLWRQLRDDQ